MTARQTVRHLDDGSVLAQWGPMRLQISAFLGRMPQQDMSHQAAAEAFKFLVQVARQKDRLKKPWGEVALEELAPLPRQMVESVRAVGIPTLTPMAAVAGTIADGVADFLLDRGMTKVLVNNGGDIAVRLAPGRIARVGIRERVTTMDYSRVLVLKALHDPETFGVATSGLGGRSLTRGIVDSATVVSGTASLADAAATAVANQSYVKCAGVTQKRARELDPETDIPDIPVTLQARDSGSRNPQKGHPSGPGPGGWPCGKKHHSGRSGIRGRGIGYDILFQNPSSVTRPSTVSAGP